MQKAANGREGKVSSNKLAVAIPDRWGGPTAAAIDEPRLPSVLVAELGSFPERTLVASSRVDLSAQMEMEDFRLEPVAAQIL